MIERAMVFLRTRLPAHSFARQVSVLASGTAIAQAIPIAVSPILTRLYPPEEFGLVALYMACVAVIAVVATLKYELAITLPASDDDAAHIVSFTLKLCAAVSVLIYLPIMFFGDAVAQQLGNPALAPWFYLLPVSVFATGAFNVFQYWCNRKSQYRQMSVNRVQNAGFTALSNIILALAKQTKGGLIIGGALGQIASAALIGRRVWNQNRLSFSVTTPRGELVQAKRYASHPKHIAPAQLIGVAAQQIPVFMIGSLFSLATVGFFSMAYRLVSLPSGLIASAIGDVYRQRISVAFSERGEFRDVFVRTLKRTTLLAAPPFIILYLLAPLLFEWVFGSSWRVAGEYAQILVVSSFFQFVFTPIDKGAVVVGATRYIFAWHVARFLGLMLLLAATGVFTFSIQKVLWWFVALNVTLYTVDGVVELWLANGRTHGK